MGQRDSMHQKTQRLGKERDRYICQVCGSRINPEGHHIINYQFGGAATADNIVTLCRDCHKQVHRGNMDIIKF